MGYGFHDNDDDDIGDDNDANRTVDRCDRVLIRMTGIELIIIFGYKVQEQGRMTWFFLSPKGGQISSIRLHLATMGLMFSVPHDIDNSWRKKRLSPLKMTICQQHHLSTGKTESAGERTSRPKQGRLLHWHLVPQVSHTKLSPTAKEQ